MEEITRYKNINKTAVIKGLINCIEYYLFMIKDKDHIIKLISTYSSLSIRDNITKSVRYMISNTNPNQY